MKHKTHFFLALGAALILVIICIMIELRVVRLEHQIQFLPLPIPIEEIWGELPSSLEGYDVQWCSQSGFIRVILKEEI